MSIHDLISGERKAETYRSPGYHSNSSSFPSNEPLNKSGAIVQNTMDTPKSNVGFPSEGRQAIVQGTVDVPKNNAGALVQKFMIEVTYYPNGMMTISRWYPVGGSLAKHRKKKKKKGQGKELGVAKEPTEEEVL